MPYQTPKENAYILKDKDGTFRLAAENADLLQAATLKYIQMIFGEDAIISQRWSEGFAIFYVNGKERFYGETVPFVREKGIK